MTLITPQQAVRRAFGDGEYLPAGVIAEADVAAAEQRYVVPVIGRTLYEKLLTGAEADFTRAYLADAVALFTRLTVQPRLDIRTGRCGTMAPKTDWGQPAGDAALCRLRKSLRREAMTLLRRAADYLATHAAEFPEYDPRQDLSNRCSTDGGLVQIR